jgi:RNA polymerase sigma-70 factor (ECF subfamily)
VDGDLDAWEEVYLAVYPRLYGYAAHRVGPDGARDVVSETMTRALAKVAGFRRDGVFDAWLFGICRNVIREHLRHATSPGTRFDAAAGRAEDPADEVVAIDERSAVRRAFARLPERDREVLELRILAGLSTDAVADVLHKHPGAIRMAQSRALGRLRSMLLVEGVGA